MLLDIIPAMLSYKYFELVKNKILLLFNLAPLLIKPGIKTDTTELKSTDSISVNLVVLSKFARPPRQYRLISSHNYQISHSVSSGYISVNVLQANIQLLKSAPEMSLKKSIC